MADVARRAGVSSATVSNVLNKPDKVSPRTQRRVLKAIRELGFVRNNIARNLAAGSTTTIGMVLTDIGNSLFVDIARGAESTFHAAGRPVLWANSDVDMEQQADYMRRFDEDRVAGVLLAPLDGPLECAHEVQSHGRPVVLVNAPGPEEGLCSVSADEEYGGFIAASHLHGKGSRSIAYVAGPKYLRAVDDRHRGVQRAADSLGFSLRIVETRRQNSPDGLEAGTALLSSAEPPDGIVCGSDLLALGVIQAAVHLGLSVPGDVRVIGYDNNNVASISPVSVSTISQPAREMGRIAAGLLLDEIAHPNEHAHQRVILRPRLIERASTL